jgi:hypothetical protein
MPWRPIDEEDLFRLDPDLARALNNLGEGKMIGEAELHRGDLIRRSQPLLKKLVGASVPPRRKAELREHISEAAVLLHQAWKAMPQIDGREVPFSEFYATRLLVKVRELDRKANPDLYDGHGRYAPPDWKMPLDKRLVKEGVEGREAHERIGEEKFSDQYRAQLQRPSDPEPDPLVRLVRAMNAHEIAVASQAGVLRFIADVWEGQIQNGRSAAKALGREEHKTHPATQPLHRTWDLLEEWDERSRELSPPPPFKFVPQPKKIV